MGIEGEECFRQGIRSAIRGKTNFGHGKFDTLFVNEVKTISCLQIKFQLADYPVEVMVDTVAEITLHAQPKI